LKVEDNILFSIFIFGGIAGLVVWDLLSSLEFFFLFYRLDFMIVVY